MFGTLQVTNGRGEAPPHVFGTLLVGLRTPPPTGAAVGAGRPFDHHEHVLAPGTAAHAVRDPYAPGPKLHPIATQPSSRSVHDTPNAIA